MLLKLSKDSAVTGYIVLIALALAYFGLDVLDFGFGVLGGDMPLWEISVISVLILLGAVIFSLVIHRQNLSKGYIVSGLLFVVLCYSDEFFFRDIELIVETLIAIVAFSMLLRSHNKISGYVSLFNGVFLLSLISILNSQFVLALPFIWIMLLVCGDNNYKNWLISLIAAALPYIFMLSFCFVFERWDVFPVYDLEFRFPLLSVALIMPLTFIFVGILAFVQQLRLLRGDIIYVRNMSLFLSAFVYFTLFFILFYTYDASHVLFPVLYALIVGKYLNALGVGGERGRGLGRRWLAELLFLGLAMGAAVV